ncbi:hypothetical protein QFZ97_002184 [Paraburkholderia youngii]
MHVFHFTEGPDGSVNDVAVATRVRRAGLVVAPLSIWYANGRARRTQMRSVVSIATTREKDIHNATPPACVMRTAQLYAPLHLRCLPPVRQVRRTPNSR